MEIYLVRHTIPNIEKGTCYGQIDIDVASSFEDEAALITNIVKTDSNTIVYSSPLKRCTKLASKFSKNKIIDDRLMELNFGDWENQKWDNISRVDLDIWMNDFVYATVPNGEAYTNLFERSNSAFEEITTANSTKLIIITHAGVIRSILSKINNTSLENSFDIKVDYGEVFKIEKQNNQYKIL